MAKTTKNILSLNHEEVMNFWLNSKEAQEGKKPKKPNFIPGGSVRAMSAICTQIALENVGRSHYALRVISRMIDSLKDMKEKQTIIDLVYHKLCNQPNSSYKNMTCSIGSSVPRR